MRTVGDYSSVCCCCGLFTVKSLLISFYYKHLEVSHCFTFDQMDSLFN